MDNRSINELQTYLGAGKRLLAKIDEWENHVQHVKRFVEQYFEDTPESPSPEVVINIPNKVSTYANAFRDLIKQLESKIEGQYSDTIKLADNINAKFEEYNQTMQYLANEASERMVLNDALSVCQSILTIEEDVECKDISENTAYKLVLDNWNRFSSGRSGYILSDAMLDTAGKLADLVGQDLESLNANNDIGKSAEREEIIKQCESNIDNSIQNEIVDIVSNRNNSINANLLMFNQTSIKVGLQEYYDILHNISMQIDKMQECYSKTHMDAKEANTILNVIYGYGGDLYGCKLANETNFEDVSQIGDVLMTELDEAIFENKELTGKYIYRELDIDRIRSLMEKSQGLEMSASLEDALNKFLKSSMKELSQSAKEVERATGITIPDTYKQKYNELSNDLKSVQTYNTDTEYKR